LGHGQTEAGAGALDQSGSWLRLPDSAAYATSMAWSSASASASRRPTQRRALGEYWVRGRRRPASEEVVDDAQGKLRLAALGEGRRRIADRKKSSLPRRDSPWGMMRGMRRGEATRRWRGERELRRRAGELCGGAEEVSSGAGELRRGGDEQGSSGSGAGSVLFVGGKGRWFSQNIAGDNFSRTEGVLRRLLY
jgi:hypothetical protein